MSTAAHGYPTAAALFLLHVPFTISKPQTQDYGIKKKNSNTFPKEEID